MQTTIDDGRSHWASQAYLVDYSVVRCDAYASHHYSRVFAFIRGSTGRLRAQPALGILMAVIYIAAGLPAVDAHEEEQTMNKISPVVLSVDESIAGFEQRRKNLLEWTAGLENDPHGLNAAVRLLLGHDMESSNKAIRNLAEWFERPPTHPAGHQGNCDFAALGLSRAWHQFKETRKLEPLTRQRIREFFLANNFESKFESENHGLAFRVSRYLMGVEFPEETFNAWKRKGKTLAAADAKWLKAFIRFRARRGWGEFDTEYIVANWWCLTALYDFAPDQELARLAGLMMNLLLVDMTVDSLNGMYGGARGRIYTRHAHDHANENAVSLQYLYFGNLQPERVRPSPTGSRPVFAFASSFRPHRLVVEVALSRSGTYINRERKHLHNTADLRPETPLAGSIRKMTLHSPHFILGAVQFQDPYPRGCKGAGYAWHEQHQWDLSFGTRTRARIFTHHPHNSGRPEHGYWTGDFHCGCTSTFQHRTAVVALYDIPSKEPCQFIHAYLPRDAFDEVVEENDWIFVREGPACAGLRMLGGHKWTTQGEWRDVEVISPGAKNAAVCEVGLLADFDGFDGFQRELAANEIRFDGNSMRLTYTSKRAGKIAIDTQRLRTVNDEPVDLDYPSFDSPYVHAAWDSEVITIKCGGKSMRLDFRAER
jgi:hypothetical protein